MLSTPNDICRHDNRANDEFHGIKPIDALIAKYFIKKSNIRYIVSIPPASLHAQRVHVG